MNFLEKRKAKLGIQSMGELRRSGKVKPNYDPSRLVNGPDNVDCLTRRWSKGDILGIIAGAGVGKTSFVLYCYREILLNNLDNNGVCIFVSLEMSKQEIAEAWYNLVGEDEEGISDRFYIIDNFDENNNAKCMGISDINTELKAYRETLGEDILSFTVDHLHIIENPSQDFNGIMKSLKETARELDSFGIVLSQTTKGKGIGDIPVAKDGSFGCSQFEWISSYVITLSQPLKRVQNQCDLPVLAWQYAKIRFKKKTDKLKESMNYCLYYDMETGMLRELDGAEKSKFAMWYEQVLELRDAEEKFKSHQYDLSGEIEGKDGKKVKINRVVGGENRDED